MELTCLILMNKLLLALLLALIIREIIELIEIMRRNNRAKKRYEKQSKSGR